MVGTGIAVGQVTPQAQDEIRAADVVMALVPDPVTAALVRSWSREFVDLATSYEEGRPRPEIYAEISGRVLDQVRQDRKVAVAIYGHPGVLCAISRFAMRAAREEGYPTRMLPGIAADACLFADLGVDPGEHGVQSYLASRFLRLHKRWDPTTPLVLWQIGQVGDDEHHKDAYPNRLLPELIAKLAAAYGPNHEAVVYEAATLPFMAPRIERVPLVDLPNVELGPVCTLLVEPLAS